MKRYFTEGYMVDKHIKRCVVIVNIREMQRS